MGGRFSIAALGPWHTRRLVRQRQALGTSRRKGSYAACSTIANAIIVQDDGRPAAISEVLPFVLEHYWLKGVSAISRGQEIVI